MNGKITKNLNRIGIISLMLILGLVIGCGNNDKDVNGQTPSDVFKQFCEAAAKGDTKTACELTYNPFSTQTFFDGLSKDKKLLKEFKDKMAGAGEFDYLVSGDHASVITKYKDGSKSLDKFVRKDGVWKIKLLE